MSDWNVSLYLQFETQRTQPSRDLAARVRHLHPEQVIDIGCGPGNSTAVLQDTFPTANLIGIDHSASMLERARKSHPDMTFEQCDVWDVPSGADLLFSNACLHWVADHPHLLPHLMEKLSSHGSLAVQMPRNAAEPLFVIIREVASQAKWNLQATNFEESDVLEPKEYHRILSDCSSQYELWETIYHHVLPNHEAMLDWVRSARLKPYLEQLDEATSRDFLSEILGKAKVIYPSNNKGQVTLCYRRLFFIAQK